MQKLQASGIQDQRSGIVYRELLAYGVLILAELGTRDGVVISKRTVQILKGKFICLPSHFHLPKTHSNEWKYRSICVLLLFHTLVISVILTTPIKYMLLSDNHT